MTIVVGFCGEKQCGKDTVASMLLDIASKQGILGMRRGMADPLKEEIAHEFAPKLGVSSSEILRQMHTPGEKERWRLIMQWWGTEFRRYEDKDYWVNKMLVWLSSYSRVGELVAIPDIRFANELDMLNNRLLRGYSVLVTRGPFKNDDAHSSEQEWKSYNKYNVVISNEGSLQDLQYKVEDLYNLVMSSMT